MRLGQLFWLFLTATWSWSVRVGGFQVSPVQPISSPTSIQLHSGSKELELALEKEVSRRVALVMAAAVAAAGNLAPAWALSLWAVAEALEFENLTTVNTKGAPEKHLPKTTVTGTKVEVVVPHVMDPETPHWIEYIWLKDEVHNKVVKVKKFTATDASPPTLTATLQKGAKVTPLLFCNLHGLWQGETITV